MRVVDEALPADGGAGFLEIDAHDDFHAVGKFLAEGVELGGVFEGGFIVVDGAGSDDDEEPGVFLA